MTTQCVLGSLIHHSIGSSRVHPLQETFQRRLEKFYGATQPLLAHFNTSASTPVVTLTGATSDEIWPQLEHVVRGSFPSLKERPETRDTRRRSSLSEAVLARQRADKTRNVA